MKPPEQVRVLWPDKDSGPHILELDLAPVAGRIQVVGVHLRSYRVIGENEPAWMPQVVPGQDDDDWDRLVELTPGLEHGSLTVVDSTGRTTSSTSTHPVKPITTQTLRTIKVAGLVEEAKPLIAELTRRVAGEWGGFGGPVGEWTAEKLRDRAERYDKAVPRPRGGRPPLSADLLKEVAVTYRQAWSRREPVIRTVAEKFTVSESMAAKYISRARSAGLLPPTKKGRAKA